MSKCNTTVTTKTGTFTFHTESVPRSKAELLCVEKGEILAPFTNKEDIDAVTGIMNWNCAYKYQNFFYIGLTVKKYGNEQIRIFSNYEVWNQGKHGSVFKDYTNKKTLCPMASLRYTTGSNPLVIANFGGLCEDLKIGYICLKPANCIL